MMKNKNIDKPSHVLKCIAMMIPKNAAQMLKSMKNKTKTREDKIAARIKYEQQQAQK